MEHPSSTFIGVDFICSTVVFATGSSQQAKTLPNELSKHRKI
jgi:hypothetical protein